MNNMYEFRFQAVRVPVLANGDVRSLSVAAEVRAATGVDGVMCARGMLENPAMFAGGNDSEFDASPLDFILWADSQVSIRRPPSASHGGCGSRSTPARRSLASITTWAGTHAWNFECPANYIHSFIDSR